MWPMPQCVNPADARFQEIAPRNLRFEGRGGYSSRAFPSHGGGAMQFFYGDQSGAAANVA
jgi:hypothetical protein